MGPAGRRHQPGLHRLCHRRPATRTRTTLGHHHPSHYREALALAQRIGDRASEAQRAGSLSNAYVLVPGLRDLDQAEHWSQHSLSLRPDSDRYGRATSLMWLGGAGQTRHNIALLLAGDGRISDALQYARAALDNYRQAGPGAAYDATDAERLITTLEQGSW